MAAQPTGLVLRREREASGLSQVTLGRALGVSGPRVSAIEAMRRPVQPRTAARVRAALGSVEASAALSLYELADELAADE